LLQITGMQLLGLLVGTAVASGALTFILGYWYVRSKIESQLEGLMDVSMDIEPGELDLPGDSQSD